MLDNFITHSSLPVQKIIWAYEGTYDASNPYYSYGQINIPIDTQNTDYKSILIDGIWTSDNWTTSYLLQSRGRVGTRMVGGLYTLKQEYMNASVNSANIVLQNYTDYGDTMKFRVWAYLKESDSSSQALEYTSAELANSFQKTTSLAQLNLIDEIEQYVPNGTTWTYTHNLGFRPLVRVWRATAQESGGVIYTTPYILATNFYPATNIQGFTPVGGAPTLVVDSTKIQLKSDDTTYSPPLDTQFLIRIYNYAMPI